MGILNTIRIEDKHEEMIRRAIIRRIQQGQTKVSKVQIVREAIEILDKIETDNKPPS